MEVKLKSLGYLVEKLVRDHSYFGGLGQNSGAAIHEEVPQLSLNGYQTISSKCSSKLETFENYIKLSHLLEEMLE